jgi:hypothetical protein
LNDAAHAASNRPAANTAAQRPVLHTPMNIRTPP